jgi:hypothetical protein
MTMHRFLSAGIALAGVASTQAQAVEYFGPVPYLAAKDTPAGFADAPTTIEDLEDGVVDAHLSLQSDVSVIGPGSLTDSVDADDGVVDGSGLGGHSLFRSTPAFEVAFAPPFPESAGLVWTDGGALAQVSVEAFDADDGSLGSYGPFTLGDGSNSGTTDEDRFFGARHAGGIRRLRISHTSGGIEVDHIQFTTNDTIFADAFDVDGAH